VESKEILYKGKHIVVARGHDENQEMTLNIRVVIPSPEPRRISKGQVWGVRVGIPTFQVSLRWCEIPQNLQNDEVKRFICDKIHEFRDWCRKEFYNEFYHNLHNKIFTLNGINFSIVFDRNETGVHNYRAWIKKTGGRRYLVIEFSHKENITVLFRSDQSKDTISYEDFQRWWSEASGYLVEIINQEFSHILNKYHHLNKFLDYSYKLSTPSSAEILWFYRLLDDPSIWTNPEEIDTFNYEVNIPKEKYKRIIKEPLSRCQEDASFVVIYSFLLRDIISVKSLIDPGWDTKTVNYFKELIGFSGALDSKEGLTYLLVWLPKR